MWQSFIVVYSISLLRIGLFYFNASDKPVDSVSRVSKYYFTRHTLVKSFWTYGHMKMCDINDDNNDDNYFFCCYKLVSLRLLEIT